jgi:hypothetical protein
VKCRTHWMQGDGVMKPDKLTIIFPIMLITIGGGWLLTTMGVAESIDWVWTLGLAVTGLLAMVIGGFNKVTVVIGPFFVVTSILSVLRQTDRLHIDVEVPILVILAGVLLLIARAPNIPAPDWILPDPHRDLESSRQSVRGQQ